MFGFFGITGVKRLIASALSSVIEILRVIPGTADAIAAVDFIAAFFGITGLAHAGATGTLTKKKLATVSAALAFLTALTYLFPELAVARPYLQKAASYIGTLAVGAQLRRETTDTVPGNLTETTDKIKDV